MKLLSYEQSLEYSVNPYGGFLGNVSFVDESYEDFKALKDSYNIAPEVNLFCIVHGIDTVYDYEENLEKKLDDLLGEYSESYLIPSVYQGVIIWELNDNN